mgnify:CR=1 FL=1
MIGLVSMWELSSPTLVMTCPICRDRCSLDEECFARLMKQQRPKGAMLMDFANDKPGFCLVTQAKTKRKGKIHEPNFFFLETVDCLPFLDNTDRDEWDMNTLFEKVSRRSQTREDAMDLMTEITLRLRLFKHLIARATAAAGGSEDEEVGQATS